MRAAALAAESRDWPSWDLRPGQICDLELILNGGFAPLAGFMGGRDDESGCAATKPSCTVTRSTR
jgi:sulfate adenylyltransferase